MCVWVGVGGCGLCVCVGVCMCVFMCVPVALWIRLPPIPHFRVPFPCSDTVKDSSHGDGRCKGSAGAAQGAEVSGGGGGGEGEADATQAAAERHAGGTTLGTGADLFRGGEAGAGGGDDPAGSWRTAFPGGGGGGGGGVDDKGVEDGGVEDEDGDVEDACEERRRR